MLRAQGRVTKNSPEVIGEVRRRLADAYFLLRAALPDDTPPDELQAKLHTLLDQVATTAAADCADMDQRWAGHRRREGRA